MTRLIRKGLSNGEGHFSYTCHFLPVGLFCPFLIIASESV